MARYKPKQGKNVGGWILIEEIDQGGNASVWKAEKAETVVAIKLLRGERDMNDEPLRRFRDEIRLMAELNGRPGVMPFLGGEAGDRCDANTPAWMAMPLSVPLVEKLGRQCTLREVVDAIASFASTLSKLHVEVIFHRDLKPGNLFWLLGSWIIGDFGIASFPRQEAHDTPIQKRFGPLFYQAPEMLNDARDAAGAPADVYALAKVLWQLGSGQAYPLPGILDVRIDAMRLSTWAGEEALLLDDVLERATLHEPADRLTMCEFADELAAWLTPVATTARKRKPMKHELQEITARLRRVQEPTRRLREEVDLFNTTMHRLRKQYPLDEIGEVFKAMNSIDKPSRDSGNLMGLMDLVLKDIHQEIRCIESVGWFVALGYSAASSGIVVALLEGHDKLHVAAVHRLGNETIWRRNRVVPVSGPVHEADIRRLVEELDGSVGDLVESVKTYLAGDGKMEHTI